MFSKDKSASYTEVQWHPLKIIVVIRMWKKSKAINFQVYNSQRYEKNHWTFQWIKCDAPLNMIHSCIKFFKYIQPAIENR